mmetsp:Transcript_37404/g.93998  ORF Transcript_37404/g.93998 Transcript_37404/m.93998 type:complete len:468 (+) Transcript_37404:53-1456(+)
MASPSSVMEDNSFVLGIVQFARKSTSLTAEELPLSTSAASNGSVATGSTTTLATGINLVATIVGAGILGFPACFGKGGWYLSPVLLLGCAWVAKEIGQVFDEALRMCAERIKAGEQFSFGTRLERYEDMLEVPFGQRGRALTFAIVNTFLLMVCGAYLILIGMSLEYLLQNTGLHPPYRVCVLAVSALFVPLSLVNDMSAITKLASIGALAGVVYVLAIAEAGIEAKTLAASAGKTISYLTLPEKLADVGGVIAVMLAGFTYQMVAPTMRAEMQKPEEFPKAVTGAVGCVLIIYGLAASTAYWGFGKDTAGNVLQSMMLESGKPMLAGYALSIAVTTNLLVTFPIIMSCVARAAESACGWRYSTLLRTGLLGAAICIGLFLPFFLEFLSLLSSVLGSAIGIFLPLAAYWALKLQRPQGEPQYATMAKHTAIMAFGFALLFIGTYNGVNDLVVAIATNTKGFWDSSLP